MFIETSFGENIGEIKQVSPGPDIDRNIGKFCYSPVPYQSSCVRADESSAAIATSGVSVADVLIPSVNSIKFDELPDTENDIVNGTIKSDVMGSIREGDHSEQSTDERKDASRYNFPDIPRPEDSSRDGDGRAEVLHDIDKHQKPNNPLILYRFSRRKSICNGNNNANQKCESKIESRHCRKIEKKNYALDLSFLKISRRRRTLFPKRDRSSVWGLLGTMLQNFEETSVKDLNVGSEKKMKSVRTDQGKKSVDVTKASKRSTQGCCPPTGRITLKIKIGNQSCGMIHVPEDIHASEKTAPVFLKNVCHEEGDKLETSTKSRCSDPGTSPDSEVINSVPDATPFGKGLSKQGTQIISVERITQKCLTNSVPDVPVVDGSSVIFLQKKSKKGRKKDKHHKCDRGVQSMPTGAKTTNSSKAPVQTESEHQQVDISLYNDASATSTAKKYLNTYSSNKGPKGPSRCSRMTDAGTPTTSKVCNSAPVNSSCEHAAPVKTSSPQPGDNLIPCSNGKKFPKFSKAKGKCKSKLEILNKASKKKRPSEKKDDRKKVVSRDGIDEKDATNRDPSGLNIPQVAGNQSLYDLGETGFPNNGANGSLNSLHFIPDELKEQYIPPRNAWVLCDECKKWRRIPAILADQIEETNSGWTCKDNTDMDFADCSIPQEKSNSEINKELEISDAEEEACGTLQKSTQIRSQAVQGPPSWSLIRSNLFLHRSRKTQTIDEVMVCHCKPPADGRMGCGAKCLNRMLNIECVRGTCPCGALCSNQQFQRRKYAKMEWFRCGKKGFGLQAVKDISQGQFLIEYVGEVLDMRAYEARQKEYALNGHRHFYFMTLNGSEVIDACAKGNLGRFINHSCDPNCQTEKWMVNGEVSVGLFAIRDIKKGEEVTFDYNYVRVFGAAAKKCVCGSPNCRGYIGGDPTNSEVIVQGDSDEEFAEPVMTCDDREMKEDWNHIISTSLRDREKETISEPLESSDQRKKPLNFAVQSQNITSETSVQKVSVSTACSDRSFTMSTARQVADVCQDDESNNLISNGAASNAVGGLLNAKKAKGESLSVSESADFNVEAEGPPPAYVSLQSEDVIKKALPSNRHTPREENTFKAFASKSQPTTIEAKRKLKYATSGRKEESMKPDSAVKGLKTHVPSPIKKEKLKLNHMNSKVSPDLDKLNSATHQSKSLPDVTLNNHVETVEKKLNELLDTEGGISKRKDASRGYLKLLFLTAASGTSGHGEAIQSNRDLSMILDALLKTKSRNVLVDIINKNGLQMLHNIMKQYRKEFNKTPILRKLLKVLRYLATRELLNLEHITGGPPCPGVESFRDSILTLTEHADKQVHQMARDFRDTWIPRHLRKKCFTEPKNVKMEFTRNPGHDAISASSSHDHSNDRVEKPAEPFATLSGSVDLPPPSNPTNNNNETIEVRVRKRKSRWDTPPRDYDDDSAPPGFSSPCKKPKDQEADSLAIPKRNPCMHPPFGTVLGNSVQKFAAGLPLSYGVPHSMLHPFGVADAECVAGLKVAPGLPFHPFPPLPTYKKTGSHHTGPTFGPKKVSPLNTTPIFGPKKMSPHNTGPVLDEPANKNDSERSTSRGGAGHLSGQKRSCFYPPETNTFRPQKWSHEKLAPPWVRMRNAQVHGGNTRNGGLHRAHGARE